MKKIYLSLLLTILSSTSFAASYQAQGCGLGATLFTDGSSLVHQVLGSITNGLSGNTFAMTSGTSDCELDGAGGQAQIVFIEANKESLANDIARGNGATLASLSTLYGCQNNAKMGAVLQKNYARIFSSVAVSALEIDSSISGLIKNNKACI